MPESLKLYVVVFVLIPLLSVMFLGMISSDCPWLEGKLNYSRWTRWVVSYWLYAAMLAIVVLVIMLVAGLWKWRQTARPLSPEQCAGECLIQWLPPCGGTYDDGSVRECVPVEKEQRN